MIKEGTIAAVFRELSPENQSVLLACARLSRIAEGAVKKAARARNGAGRESALPAPEAGKRERRP
jgi:hypothetical protein